MVADEESVRHVEEFLAILVRPVVLKRFEGNGCVCVCVCVCVVRLFLWKSRHLTTHTQHTHTHIHIHTHTHTHTRAHTHTHLSRPLHLSLPTLPSTHRRRRMHIRNQIIHKISAARTRVSQPHHLDRCRLQSKNLGAGAFGVAIEIDKHVNAVSVDAVGDCAVVQHACC